jgi:ribosomal subunit interface protein
MGILMHIDIHAKNLELNQTLRTFIEEKVADLERLAGDVGPVHAKVEVSIPSAHHQSGPIYSAEINLTIAGHLLRAESSNYDLHSAIVDAKDELKVQVGKFKDKAREKERKPSPESIS